MPISKIKNAPPEIFRDRFVLIGIIFSIWAFIKFLEFVLPERVLEILPGPIALSVFFIFIGIMASYMCITYFAQRWQARKKSKASKNLEFDQALHEERNSPPIDILIAAHNEQSVIVGTIENLLEIDYPNFHITIADDRSSDGTAKLIEDFIQKNNLSSKITLLRRFKGSVPGKAASLNEAIQTSKGELIAIFDADARVESNCLKLAVKYFKDPQVAAVQFQKKVRNADFNTLTFCQDLEFAYDTYLQIGRDSVNGFVELRGSGQIISRKCFEEVGLWDERSLTEDLEMSTRININGWKIKPAPEIIAYEEGLIEPRAFIKQRRRWAEGSIRRYLTHINSFLNPKSKLTLIKRLDILPYLSQFAVPVWIFLDVLLEVYRFFTNQPTYITVLMLATVLVGTSMWMSICVGVRRWRDFSTLESIKYGTLAFFYGATHWPPIVLWTMRKIIFGRRPTQWIKTPRMLELVQDGGSK
ncbi:MAG: glycosyltransferase [Candidatus Caenarcaniphilales bacterium]|nr:glycosyltransferase [Candidatus Caenarcaniphilales bacterium]